MCELIDMWWQNKAKFLCVINEERICYAETGFGSDLVLGTVYLLSETFLETETGFLIYFAETETSFRNYRNHLQRQFRRFRLSEYRCSQIKTWRQVNDTCCWNSK